MTASGIVDRRNNREAGFTTAEIKSRIEAMFEARTPATQADRYDSHDRDEIEP